LGFACRLDFDGVPVLGVEGFLQLLRDPVGVLLVPQLLCGLVPGQPVGPLPLGCASLNALRGSYYRRATEGLHYLFECDGSGRERFVYYCSSCACVLGVKKELQLVGDLIDSLEGRCPG
jgi:hypothetical protein